MLVLINGISGNMGGAIARELLLRGHQVRGLGRSPDSVDVDLKDKLESFVTAANWYDTIAHDRACEGVEAVVNATAAQPHLMLDHSLLLLRAAERAHVKIFVADSWNYNWTKTPLGYHEAYDPLIMFKQQTELTSELKPIYVFTGVLAEFWFNVPVKGWFQNGNPAFNAQQKFQMYFGDGKLRHQLTTFQDAAQYTVSLLTSPTAAEGGCFEVMSFGADVWQIKEAYKEVTGQDLSMQCAGSIDDMKNIALGGRAQGHKNKFMEYIGMLYLLFTHEGKWILDEKDLYSPNDKKPTSLHEFLDQHKGHFLRETQAAGEK